MQPSLGRVGGLLEARKVAALAEGFSVQVAPHHYAGPVAWAAAIQLGLTVPNFLILETIGNGAGSGGAAEAAARAGRRGRPAPGGAGLGVEVEEAVGRAPYRGDRLHLEISPSPRSPGGARSRRLKG